MLASVIANISGKTLKRPLKEKDFMPNYLNERKATPEKSLEQQAAEFQDFKKRLAAVSPQSMS